MKEMNKLIERFNKLTLNELTLLDYGVTIPHYYTVKQKYSYHLYHFKSCKEFREIMKAFKEEQERAGWKGISLSMLGTRKDGKE